MESTTRDVAENSAAGADVGGPVTAADTDGDDLTYTLEGTDAASFTIVSTSGQIQTKTGVTYDHELHPEYSVTVKADDGNGGTDTIAVTINITDVEEPPLGPGSPHGLRRLRHDRQPVGELERPRQRRQARHRVLRPAIPQGDHRQLD